MSKLHVQHTVTCIQPNTGDMTQSQKVAYMVGALAWGAKCSSYIGHYDDDVCEKMGDADGRASTVTLYTLRLQDFESEVALERYMHAHDMVDASGVNLINFAMGSRTRNMQWGHAIMARGAMFGTHLNCSLYLGGKVDGEKFLVLGDPTQHYKTDRILILCEKRRNG